MPQIRFSEFNLWKKQKSKNRNLASFSLEVTSRCNNNCRHCCINMPVNDKKAEAREMTFEQIQENLWPKNFRAKSLTFEAY